jgi:hypothetical protein
MIEIEPRGFKYIVTTSLSENLGQAGRCVLLPHLPFRPGRDALTSRADLSCHWEDTDVAIQEMFSNVSYPLRPPSVEGNRLRRQDSIILVCLAFAVRVI